MTIGKLLHQLDQNGTQLECDGVKLHIAGGSKDLKDLVGAHAEALRDYFEACETARRIAAYLDDNSISRSIRERKVSRFRELLGKIVDMERLERGYTG